MNDCFICDKHAEVIETAGITIHEDEYVYVGHIDRAGAPNYLGHIMIDLKRHVPTLAELTTDEATVFGIIMARVSKALKESESAEHIYALVSGNSVPHLHMHLIARYPGTPKEHWGPMDVYGWEDAPMGTEEDVVRLCLRLKTYLEEDDHE
ncbi:HIT family protein [Exiguobacterium flavidum]|uniref:HIT family protein n=1 Tax=Exiguobacterium flavidum TaxID=2184695 RepID=UPI000DF7F8EB|nr:HIT family protein [Exiguobacterium flavidum]